MLIRERLQTLIHRLEVQGLGKLRLIPAVLALIGLMGLYDLVAYRSFFSPEAMDAAQVARNISEGNGFSTHYIRPFSTYLMRKHNEAAQLGIGSDATGFSMGTNDFAQVKTPHPDLANAPLYPLVLAGLMKAHTPDWNARTTGPLWSEGGRFVRYKPEVMIAVFNQVLLMLVVVMTFFLAKKLFDTQTAWLAALITLGADLLWKFSVSGLSTMLLLAIFMGLCLCLLKIEELGRAKVPRVRLHNMLVLAAGLLVGAGMMTRYSFGWMIIPVVVYLVLFGGQYSARAAALPGPPSGVSSGFAVMASLGFIGVVTPWIVRNVMVSGTLFGTAGYAVAEGTFSFPGTQLMQATNPDLGPAYWVTPYTRKLLENLRQILQGDLLRCAGWIGILFFAGLLAGLQNIAARRLRYFTMMSLAGLIIAQALGKTQLSAMTVDLNTENLLVLLLPLMIIFGAGFFMTLLERMNVPSLQIRYWVMGLLVALAWQPMISTLLPPRVSPVSYPPYYPPEIQQISKWMREDELIMSDIPWAVAWYGHRQCAWTTINSQYEYFRFNDHVKQVKALYLTLVTLDGRLLSECLQGPADGWGNFVLKSVAAGQIPDKFPLRSAPYGLSTGLFLTDRQRW